ncbi:MAG: MDR family MFS transporter [Tepidiformaceae bacterium]
MAAVEMGRPLGEVLDRRQRWLLLGSLMLAMFVGAIDQTVVATATPRILADLGGFPLLSWLFTSYMLSSTVVIPLVGKLSDTFGRKYFVFAGLFVFMVASIACGAAPNMPALIAFRAVQGLGGGMIFASVFASIGDIFPPAERAKYMGLFTGTFSLASILGPAFGGFLTDNGGWRWVFYINVPFVLVAMPAIWLNLPARRALRRPKIDFAGAALLSLASVLLLLAFEWAGKRYDWDSAQIIGLVAAALTLTGAFIYQESRHPEPILPLHLFRNRTFVLSNLSVFLFGMGMFGALQYLGLFVQTALGASATASGVIATPQALGLLGASVIGGQAIARSGRYQLQTIIGSVIIVLPMLYFTGLDVNVARWELSLAMVVLGIGFGLTMPTMSLMVQNAVPYRYLGVASSSSQFFRQIGSVFGIAIFAAVLTNSYEAAFEDNLSAGARATIVAAEASGAAQRGTLEQFEDPTLFLNAGAFAVVQRELSALPGGEQVLAEATAAQRVSVATAVRHIFLGATAIAVLCLMLSFLIRELPLRRDFKDAAAPRAQSPGPVLGETEPSPAGSRR